MDPTALGRYLRETREAKERTLDDAVTALKIRRTILESFEQGNFAVADSQVQVRGMLRNYARFLGLEEERILEYYAATQNNIPRQRRRFGRVVEEESQLQAPRKITDTQPKPPTMLEPPPDRFGWVAGALRNAAFALISLASIVVIGFIIYDTLDLGGATGDEGIVQAGLQTASAQPPGTITPTYTATWTPRPADATATTDFSMAGIGGVQVSIEMLQRSFVRVSVDGNEQFAGVMEPGDEARYEGSNQIELTAASAPAVLITFNGIEQEPFGVRGQQAMWLFSPTGLEVMTDGATLTPTATASPTQTSPEATAEVTQPLTAPAQSQADAASVAETDLPTPTSIFANSPVPSPTVEGAAPAATGTQSVTDASAPTTEGTADEDRASAAPTMTPSATSTATPAAPLPLRATSETIAPTKPPP